MCPAGAGLCPVTNPKVQGLHFYYLNNPCRHKNKVVTGQSPAPAGFGHGVTVYQHICIKENLIFHWLRHG